jgi:polyferredoxin
MTEYVANYGNGETAMHNRLMQPIRIAVQLFYLVFTFWLGVSFFRFVLHFRSGGLSPFSSRPAAIEAFLPISGLLGLRDWAARGEINAVHPAAVVIFVTALLVSLLLKRSFCSWICPVGAVSEMLWKLGFSRLRRNLRPPPVLDYLLRGVKYLLLAFFLSSILIMMPAAAVNSFIASDYHKIADVRLLDFFLNLSPLALGVITVLAVLSLFIRNAFCRYGCPYGALLGLISMLSPAKVTRHADICVSCGVCSQVCPSYLPVMSSRRVSSPECIGCWRCISHCRADGALTMQLWSSRLALPGLLFALLVVVLFWGGSVMGKLTGNWQTAVTYDEYRQLTGK